MIIDKVLSVASSAFDFLARLWPSRKPKAPPKLDPTVRVDREAEIQANARKKAGLK